MVSRSQMGITAKVSLGITMTGLAYHTWLIFSPPASGNGITTLPLVLFLLLALAPTLLDWSGAGQSRVRLALRRDRRYLGICAGLWAIAHALTKSEFSLGSQPAGWAAHVLRPEIAPALVGLLIVITMLGTSNDRAQERMGAHWKALHNLIWVVPGIALVHGWTASAIFTVEGAMNAPVLIPLLVICAGSLVGLLRAGTVQPFAYLMIGIAFSTLLLLSLNPGPAITVLME